MAKNMSPHNLSLDLDRLDRLAALKSNRILNTERTLETIRDSRNRLAHSIEAAEYTYEVREAYQDALDMVMNEADRQIAEVRDDFRSFEAREERLIGLLMAEGQRLRMILDEGQM